MSIISEVKCSERADGSKDSESKFKRKEGNSFFHLLYFFSFSFFLYFILFYCYFSLV